MARKVNKNAKKKSGGSSRQNAKGPSNPKRGSGGRSNASKKRGGTSRVKGGNRPTAKRLAGKRLKGPTKKSLSAAAKKAALSRSLLFDESLLSLLNKPGKKGAIGRVLKGKREKWIDQLISRAPVEGKKRGKKTKRAPGFAERKPEPKQFYTESRAISDGKALLAYLENRPFILRALGFEGFTFAPRSKKKKGPSRKDLKQIRELDFVKEIEPKKERAAMVKHLAEAFRAANAGGIMFQAEIDYERGKTRSKVVIEDDEETDDDFDSAWEVAKQRDSKTLIVARKTRKKASRK